ncbi:hypothetical protein CfE428DRAFT_5352 [Chthoniobacter flavus Ellin428]|uniref:Uncharacterized protein n=1 Tax=Chthoniobacter flavus Ellin428 TaxID=497964 RepID=B4D8W2_9BACT|nr:hypothetical protein [Chthoniobacter flavus]EDY17170.1 hypothetical protein CfE428DRAFT_5352 [Chthoniobacter flavus Ellin428]TCO90170.1 hypothetical protein EV701_11196 [Chthoniobacter flavus]
MKKWLLALFLIATSLHAAEVVEKDLGFRIVFPDLPGWTHVQRRELGETRSGWFSHFDGEKPADRLTAVITVSFEHSPETATFLKFVQLWHKQQFGTKAEEFKPHAFKVNDHDACEFSDTQIDHSGHPAYLRTVLVRAGDVTYAATFITSDPANLKVAAGSGFLDSLQLMELQKAPAWPKSR